MAYLSLVSEIVFTLWTGTCAFFCRIDYLPVARISEKPVTFRRRLRR
jgi:hypothetical protein